jgi:hypothetical protein
MLSLGTLTVVGVVAVAALAWFLVRMLRQDQLSAIMDKRKATARLITRADYVEGMERMPVALALTNDTFHYENADLEASFELARIDEVEYDDELSTGRHSNAGERVMRLRSHNHAFEFLLPLADTAKWQAVLPEKRMSNVRSAASA